MNRETISLKHPQPQKMKIAEMINSSIETNDLSQLNMSMEELQRMKKAVSAPATVHQQLEIKRLVQLRKFTKNPFEAKRAQSEDSNSNNQFNNNHTSYQPSTIQELFDEMDIEL